jgi:hypothetical protein
VILIFIIYTMNNIITIPINPGFEVNILISQLTYPYYSKPLMKIKDLEIVCTS